MRTSQWLIAVAGVLVVFGLPLAGKWARHTREMRCAFDGAQINSLYRVRVLDAHNQNHVFCCIHCAELWLSHESVKPQSIQVTDEATGREVDAGSAWFVRSLVVTVPHTGNRIHAFGAQADATRHAETARGKLLPASEKPFKIDGTETHTDERPTSESPRR